VFGASVAVYVVLVVLVIAVAERVVAPGALRAAIVAHRVVPRGAAGSAAVAVTAVEAVLVAALLIGLVQETGPSPVVLSGAAALFAAYGGYAWHVTASGRGGPCGCGGADVPMDHWVTGRAVVLAALAATGAVAHSSVLPLAGFDDRTLVVVLAAATIGVLLWHLPAALARPQPDHRR
jgi:methylamine utilization protein MauE